MASHPAIQTQQRHAPLRQLVQRRHRPRDNRVHLPHLLSYGPILGPPPDDRHVEAEIVDHLAQKLAAAKQWFDQRHSKVRPRQRQRYPGQAGSTTDVGDPLAGFEEFGDRRAIQYVAIPQPVHLSWSEQAPLDARARQDLCVPLSAIQSRSEECRGHSRCRGHLDMFHVKHPPDLTGRQRGSAA